MPTAGVMVDEVLGLLQAWASDESQSATLAGSMASGDLTGSNTGSGLATGMTVGINEIDRELIYVDSISGTNFTMPAWGRGYKSTTAVSHAAGARIISQPTFPRQKIFDYINETINRVFPDVYAVGSVELTTTFPKLTYSVPLAQWILNVKWLVPDGRSYWQAVLRWRVSPGGGTMFGDSGITVDVAEQIMPGRPIQFLYATQATALVNESDDFVTTTGLHSGMRDVIVLGAAAKAVAALELSRLQVTTVEQQNRSQQVAPSAALSAAKYLSSEYQTRLMEERQTLQRLYPPRVTREWI